MPLDGAAADRVCDRVSAAPRTPHPASRSARCRVDARGRGRGGAGRSRRVRGACRVRGRERPGRHRSLRHRPAADLGELKRPTPVPSGRGPACPTTTSSSARSVPRCVRFVDRAIPPNVPQCLVPLMRSPAFDPGRSTPCRAAGDHRYRVQPQETGQRDPAYAGFLGERPEGRVTLISGLDGIRPDARAAGDRAGRHVEGAGGVRQAVARERGVVSASGAVAREISGTPGYGLAPTSSVSYAVITAWMRSRAPILARTGESGPCVRRGTGCGSGADRVCRPGGGIRFAP